MRFKTIAVALLSLPLLLQCANKKPDVGGREETKVWKLNNLERIGGNEPEVWGDPAVVAGQGGEKAVRFDGKDDGLLIRENPIAGAEEFTIDVVFRPAAGFPENREQRFLHIQDPENENRRILIELRLNHRNEWYGDWFIKTEHGGLTLIDSTKTHPVGEWATIRLVYKDKQLRGIVNGVQELTGEIEYLPISAAAPTSVGVRMNRRSWFKGEIQEIRFSPKALLP